jgi:chromosome segregation ATPase
MKRTLASDLMKALRQLGFLKLNFRQEVPPPEEDRVLTLFRNRAELKKAYGALEDEIYRLKDRIKQQEGATQRVQEMLNALETRLGMSDTGYPALVFYQLRRLWQSGRELIEQFVAELARQQEDRERRQHLAEHNRKQFPRRQTVEQQLRDAESHAADEANRVAELETERARLTRFWHYFKRRALEHRITEAVAKAVGANATLTDARAAAAELEKEPVPEFPGLSVETRRAINLTALAYAEVLCSRLIKTDLVKLGREATQRRECTDDYGTPAECEALMRDIDKAMGLIQGRSNQEIGTRAERLKKVAKYRGPNDTSPTSDSVAFSEGDVLSNDPQGGASARMPNVLAEDTWDLFRILLR